VTGTAALFALFGYINLRVVRQQSEDLVLQAAERVTDLILRSAHFGMLHHDRETLYNTIQDMGAEPGIRRIRIFNKEGRIAVSAEAREVGAVVDKSAEACYGCHCAIEAVNEAESAGPRAHVLRPAG